MMDRGTTTAEKFFACLKYVRYCDLSHSGVAITPEEALRLPDGQFKATTLTLMALSYMLEVEFDISIPGGTWKTWTSNLAILDFVERAVAAKAAGSGNKV